MLTIDDNKLFRPGEAMAVLGVRPTKFWDLVKRDAFEARKLGSCTVIPGYSLKAFIEGLPAANGLKHDA